jgi:hypothetical protein
MTKQELNGPDVGAGFKQMHGEGMTLIPISELSS